MTRLSVNVNKVASLRNARGGNVPDVCVLAKLAVVAGAQGITVHPRPDLRHIRPEDVYRLAEADLGVELNIEGNPFAPANTRYPGLLTLVRRVRPAQVTFVPDGDAQLTSDHGISFAGDLSALAEHIAACREAGARVSVFVDAEAADFERAAQLGADRIEIYTGPYAQDHAAGRPGSALAAIARTAARASAAGLGINAGHDLDQHNLGELCDCLGPALLEVSIGHALIADALVDGLAATIARYLAILNAATA